MTTSLRSLGLAVACALWAVGGRRSDSSHDPAVIRRTRSEHARRRRRFTATPACGSCRPPRCCEHAEVVGQRLPRAARTTSQGFTQRRRLRRHVRVRRPRPRGDLRLVPVRHAHRSRPAAALHRQRPGRRRRRSTATRASTAGLDRRQRRRLPRRREGQPAVGSRPEAGRRSRFAACVKLPTGDEDAGVSTGKARLRRRLHRQQGDHGPRRGRRLRRVRVPRRARRLRAARAARSAGASAPASRRAARCASPPS